MVRLPIFTDSKRSPMLIITIHLQKKDKENADIVEGQVPGAEGGTVRMQKYYL